VVIHLEDQEGLVSHDGFGIAHEKAVRSAAEVGKINAVQALGLGDLENRGQQALARRPEKVLQLAPESRGVKGQALHRDDRQAGLGDRPGNALVQLLVQGAVRVADDDDGRFSLAAEPLQGPLSRSGESLFAPAPGLAAASQGPGDIFPADLKDRG